MISIITRRVYDIALCTEGVSVTMNGKKIPPLSSEDYLWMFAPPEYKNARKNESILAKGSSDELNQDSGEHDGMLPWKPVTTRVNTRWSVGVCPSDGHFKHISFVNGVNTTRGGTHVNFVSEQLTKKIAEHINKRFKGIL